MLEIVITSSVLIVGILCLRRLTFGKISMGIRYALWLPVVLRLLLPVSLGESPFSVMNLLPKTGQESEVYDAAGETERKDSETDAYLTFIMEMKNSLVVTRNPSVESGGTEQAAVSDAEFQSDRLGEFGPGTDAAVTGNGPFSGSMVLRYLWLSGVLAVGGYFFISRLRFACYLHQNRREISEETLSEEWKERLRRRGRKVYRVRGLPSPCLAGRHIYIGEEVTSEAQGLSHILAHEYCHALHGDSCWAFLRCALVAVYWFDPLVWAAAFAARQDSELACDEAAVRLLGEEKRFAYGRTLLALLPQEGGKRNCPGMSSMLEGGERSVKERITALAEKSRPKGAVLSVALIILFLICGCAFTGARTDEAEAAEATVGEENREPDGKLNPEQIDKLEELALQEAQRAFFEDVLNYHGVMEGKDDSELTLNRRIDYQAYYEYRQGEGENPLEDGWYLLCHNEEAGVSVYGLYTEEFGCRGLKVEVSGDVNTYDAKWGPSPVNENQENIRVLEWTADNLPRRLVWKLIAEENSNIELWRLYSGFRYDTGTIDMKMVTEQECRAWAEQNLTFTVDQEADRVKVVYDENETIGTLDVSAYKGCKIESAQISPDVCGFDFEMDREIYGEKLYGDYEGIVAYIGVALKLEGDDEFWIDGLHPLAVQVVEDESELGFKLQQPKIDENREMHSTEQQRRLREVQKE